MNLPTNDTTGFYKNIGDYLSFAKNVWDINLYYEKKDDYIYPVNEWYWFNDAEEARLFFNMIDCLIKPDHTYSDIDPLIFDPAARPKI